MFVLFNQAVKNYPDNLAFILSNKERISFQQADNIVTLWAHYLITIGIKQGDCLAVLTQEEDLYPFLHLALDKLNATIVPFDSETPTEQLKHIPFVNSILIEEALAPRYACPTITVISLKINGIYPPDTNKLESVLLPEIIRDPSIPNYIVASSGTTEDKKWIPILSEGLEYWGNLQKTLLKLSSEEDKILCTRSPAYDARIFEYIHAFATGCPLVLISQYDRRDLDEIVQQCELERISSLVLISSLLSTSNQDEIICRLARAGLKHLIVTGDACPLSLKLTCEKYHIQLWNGYGPTETTFGMSLICVNGIYLVDEQGQQIVPIGPPNDVRIRYHLINNCLYIESPFLSPGYLNNEERTQHNFPILTIEGRSVRVFNTGDKFTESNSYLIFGGRINSKSPAKVSGHKVEARPIQLCLEHFNQELGEKALQVHVVIKPWMNGPLKPVAYMVVERDFSKEHFDNYLKARLRKEERPILVKLPKLPRMIPSDKINERELIARVDAPTDLFYYEEQPESSEPFNPSNSEKFNQLQQIWERVLGIKSSNIDLEFLFAGGDSSQLVQLHLFIKKEIDPDFKYKQLLYLPALTLRHIYLGLESGSSINTSRAIIQPLRHAQPKRPNYFFLPPLLGEGYFTYRRFAEIFSISYQVNIYGLSDPAIHDRNLLPQTLEEAADRYIQAIRSVQPKGPYHLLGYSYGCTLAWFVAKKLIDCGERVSALHMVDGYPPIIYQKLQSADHARLLLELIAFVEKILGNSYYGEKLAAVSYPVHLEHLNHYQQIKAIFDALELQIQKSRSKALVALARQHLILAINASEQPKLAVQTFFYLSKKDQYYLQAIDQIPLLPKRSLPYQYYFWNSWVEEIVLGINKRADTDHLGLLVASPSNPDQSADIFFQSHRERFYPQWRPKVDISPFYTRNVAYYTENEHSPKQISYTVFCLEKQTVKITKANLSEMIPALRFYTSPLFEQHCEMVNDEALVTSRYSLSFTIPSIHFRDIEAFLIRNYVRYNRFSPLNDSYAKAVSELIFQKKPAPFFYFTININHWDGRKLMSLAFRCRGCLNALLGQIYKETGLEIDRELSEPENASFHLTITTPTQNASAIYHLSPTEQESLYPCRWSRFLAQAPTEKTVTTKSIIEYYRPLIHNLIFWINPVLQGLKSIIYDTKYPYRIRTLPAYPKIPIHRPRFFNTNCGPKSKHCNRAYSPLVFYPTHDTDLNTARLTRIQFRNDILGIHRDRWIELDTFARHSREEAIHQNDTPETLLNHMDIFVVHANQLKYCNHLLDCTRQEFRPYQTDPALWQQTNLYWLETAWIFAQSLIPELNDIVSHQAIERIVTQPIEQLLSLSLVLHYLGRARRYNPISKGSDIIPFENLAYMLASHINHDLSKSEQSFEELMISNLRHAGKEDEARFVQAEQLVLSRIMDSYEDEDLELQKGLSMLSEINREKFECYGHSEDLAKATYQAERCSAMTVNNKGIEISCKLGMKRP